MNMSLSRNEIFLFVLAAAVVSVIVGITIDPLLSVAVVVALALLLLFSRFPYLGAFFVAFLLPFERIGGVDIGGFTIRASQVIMILALLGTVIWMLLHRKTLKPIIQRNPAILPLIAFLIINLLGLLVAPNLPRSITVLAVTAFTFLPIILLPLWVTNADRLRGVIRALLFTTFIVCVFGLFQFVGDIIGLPTSITGLRPHYTQAIFGFPRIQSTSLEPLYFANFLLIPIGLCIALLVERQWVIRPGLVWLTLMLASMNLILTVSRGGYLAVLGLAGVLGLVYIRSLFSWKLVLMILGSILVAGTLAFQLLGFQDVLQTNRERFADQVVNVFSGASFVERVETMDLALRAFYQSPWIGMGPGSFGPLASIHPLAQPLEGWKIVNNETLELLTETGILGLASILSLLVILFSRGIAIIQRAQPGILRATCIALTAVTMGFVIQYQTFSTLYILHIWFIIGLWISCLQLLQRQPKS